MKREFRRVEIFESTEPALEDIWMALQRALAASSTRGTLTVVSGSGRFVEVDKPQAFIDTVRPVMNSVRSDSVSHAGSAHSPGGRAPQ